MRTDLPIQRWSILGYRPNGWAYREVHQRDEKFVAITTCRQSGKSVTAKMEFDYGMTRTADNLYGPPRVGLVGPEYSKAEAVVFAWYEMVTRAFGEGYAILDKTRHTVTIPSTGAVGYWMTSSNIAGLVGMTFSYLILDESQLIADASWQVLYPTTSVRSAPIRCFGTPDITPDQSWYRGLWLRGRASENDEECHSYTVTCYENAWIPPAEIARAKATMSDTMFRMLYLGEWVTGFEDVFERIENAFYPGATAHYNAQSEYVMTVDPAVTEDYWVVMLGEPSTGRVLFMDRWHRIPLGDAYLRVKRFWERYGNPRVYLDAGGVGRPMLEEFRGMGMQVTGLIFGANNKMEIIHRLNGAIQHGRIRFPQEWEPLISELRAFIYATTASGKITAQAAATYHDDCVSALAIMNEAFRHRPQDDGGPGQYRANPNGPGRFDPRRPRSMFSENI